MFPWDVEERRGVNDEVLILDIREECEFSAYHIRNSMLVPAVSWKPPANTNTKTQSRKLIEARDREIIVICRSGNRSVLAAQTMQWMGYENVASMKTGLRGWNDYELPLYNVAHEELDPDQVEEMLAAGFVSSIMHPDRRTIVDD